MKHTETTPDAIRRGVALLTVVLTLIPLTACASAGTTGMSAQTPMNASTIANATLPDHIVNGDFEAYTWRQLTGGQQEPGLGNWTSIDPATGASYVSSNNNHWSWKVTDWDNNRFAWASTQVKGASAEQRAGAVELQKEDDTNNIYAEITAAQAGTAIYQDINTASDTPVVYRVRLDHASISRTWLDKMQVLVGKPGEEQAVPMTRTSSNGNGDQTGETSDVIATTVSNQPQGCHSDGVICSARNHKGQWETYEGQVTIPAGQQVTRFTFLNKSSSSNNSGNLVDNIVFEKAYPLNYDANGGTLTQTPGSK
ncbi:repeat, TIGR02543 family [Bifidobacterium saguini DSM 23967]|uniref:Repeat, TIGR02543 family n=3 Tax=Bifidobacterium saguini TaxID=762210 RepID=A0A087D6V6_9BIFI|nr:repeat, TIGR02543 family [Bifidobacterium saguini DSM 23967]